MPERSNEKRNGGNRKSSRPITQQFRCTPRRATARCQVGPYKSEQIVGPLEKAPERAQIWDQPRTEERSVHGARSWLRREGFLSEEYVHQLVKNRFGGKFLVNLKAENRRSRVGRSKSAPPLLTKIPYADHALIL